MEVSLQPSKTNPNLGGSFIEIELSIRFVTCRMTCFSVFDDTCDSLGIFLVSNLSTSDKGRFRSTIHSNYWCMLTASLLTILKAIILPARADATVSLNYGCLSWTCDRRLPHPEPDFLRMVLHALHL